MRLIVYSHDTFGLGNIRRMLAICNYLLDVVPNLSILLISGSPMLHSFRLPSGLDYLKLPCLNRGEQGNLSVKYLGTETNEAVKLRADVILAATINYKPDIFLVDKKPYGVANELIDTLNYCKSSLPQTKVVLLLRDIIDTPEVTIKEWCDRSYYQAVETFYHQVLVVGMPEVFDIPKEYKFPSPIAQKVKFCGYVRKQASRMCRQSIRQELQIEPNEQLALVTPGGGQDGWRLVETYLAGLQLLPKEHQFKSLIICGSEMPLDQQRALFQMAEHYSDVQIKEFTNDLLSYMNAADVVVSMAGYNTITEICSLQKPAVVVPRIAPVKEQLIRAERLAQLGLFQVIHPDSLTPQVLVQQLIKVNDSQKATSSNYQIDLGALPRIRHYLFDLMLEKVLCTPAANHYQNSLPQPCLAIVDPK